MAVWLGANSTFADRVVALPNDSSRVVDIEEVVVIGSPKENAKLRQMPLASSLISKKDMQDNQISSSKDLSFYSPNLYIPNYGSNLTSAIYLRGVGSRLGTPAVGMYVDNVPYIDKSAFNFNFSDIERIDVLRGPQGTLYGLNSMGGLIKIHTKSPFDYQGTDLNLGAATYDNYNASFTHYHRVSNKFAFSAGGFISHKGGFFTNTDSAFKKKVDWENSVGGRLHAIYLPTDRWKIDLNANYEYVTQGGNPYKNLTTNTVAYNSKSGYHRNLVNASLDVEYAGDNYVMNAVTGFQYLKDHMSMDQDYTSLDFFSMEQRQNQHTFTEEITFKSKAGHRWDWTTGAFGYYQWLNTDSPMVFGPDFISYLQNIMDVAMTGSPVKITLTDKSMDIPGAFKTPSMGTALFHQSTYHDLLNIKGLSGTIGLRADVQRVKVNYNTSAVMNYNQTMFGKTTSGNSTASFVGDTAKTYFQLLPKFALQYDFDANNNVYATVSRGYRGGGYNIQALSDYISAELEGSSTKTTTSEANTAITYKPEYTWSYEVGSHMTLLSNRLWADADVFCMQTRNQQITKFNSLGGREVSNAGESRSYGAELSMKAALNQLTLDLNYGYTHSTFEKYTTIVNSKDADYSHNYVPFVPEHTFSLGAEYAIACNGNSCIKGILFGANYAGAANIRWDEANTVKQSFYGTLNAHATVKMGKVSVCLWEHNLLNKHYNTFYFSELGTNFAQSGAPAQAGIDLRFSF